MSPIILKSPNHCGAKQSNNLISTTIANAKTYKKLLFLFTTLLSITLLVWLILRPSNPHFSLRQADVNLSSIQVTVFASNPNSKHGIFYDDLSLHAVYKGQQITLDASLPPFYQDRQDSNILTVDLVGVGLPVASSSFGYEVERDKAAGKVIFIVEASGRLRWKVGTWVSGHHRFFVNCVAEVPFGPVVPSGPLSVKQGTQCSTKL